MTSSTVTAPNAKEVVRPKRAIIFTEAVDRPSDPDRAARLAELKRTSERLATQLGVVMVGTCAVGGGPDGPSERSLVENMLLIAERKAATYLIVHHYDRLTRSSDELTWLEKQLKTIGADLVIVTDPAAAADLERLGLKVLVESRAERGETV